MGTGWVMTSFPGLGDGIGAPDKFDWKRFGHSVSGIQYLNIDVKQLADQLFSAKHTKQFFI
jgi:hypothetical protein